VLTATFTAVRDSWLDLNRLRVVLDWVQYRQSFREIVDLRRIMPSALQTGEKEAYELAVDLRRATSANLEAEFGKVLGRNAEGASTGRQYLEEWGAESDSCIWGFNGLYWNALGLWERATGREYEQALPGGETAARNAAAAREMIEDLFNMWDGLATRGALPEELYVLELGVGNGNQAKVWLDEFQKLDRDRNGEYYRRLHYLMGDYSPHVLERARENVKIHSDHTSSLVLDARVPMQTLGFLRGKAFFIYISNVYDNLPTDEVVRIGGHMYQVEVRAYIPEDAATTIATGLNVRPEELPDLTHRLVQLGPELLARSAPDKFPEGAMQAVGFWKSVWEAIRLEERYVPIEGLDAFKISSSISGELLRPIVEANGDVRMHVSNGAAASFLDSLPLLHPFGILKCLDIFVTDINQYETFRGPGKYDGSVVNWVNGPVLAALGRRNGYDVTYESFAQGPGNIQVMNARVQE
jgi:hypothetical protein